MRLLRRIAIGFAVFIGLNTLAALIVRMKVPAYGTASDDEVSIVAAMSGGPFVSTATALRSIAIVAYMGGVELDLRNATIIDGAVVRICAVMGGVDIVVPDGWRVETTNKVFMGGVENGTNPDFVPESAPLLIVDISAYMGGVEIHTAEAA